jgi:signal transduction histidine kinase
MQQASARGVGGVAETVTVAELMDDAIKFNSLSSERQGTAITRELQETPPLMVDRNMVLQVLINLLSNARHAVAESPVKKIVLRSRATEDHIEIEVEDTGCGIAPENRAKVFSHGFTTKKNGHGFGLHSSANAATQLGGRLLVRSDGIGKGACFTFVLPLNRDPVSSLH